MNDGVHSLSGGTGDPDRSANGLALGGLVVLASVGALGWRKRLVR